MNSSQNNETENKEDTQGNETFKENNNNKSFVEKESTKKMRNIMEETKTTAAAEPVEIKTGENQGQINEKAGMDKNSGEKCAATKTVNVLTKNNNITERILSEGETSSDLEIITICKKGNENFSSGSDVVKCTVKKTDNTLDFNRPGDKYGWNYRGQAYVQEEKSRHDKHRGFDSRRDYRRTRRNISIERQVRHEKLNRWSRDKVRAYHDNRKIYYESGNDSIWKGKGSMGRRKTSKGSHCRKFRTGQIEEVGNCYSNDIEKKSESDIVNLSSFSGDSTRDDVYPPKNKKFKSKNHADWQEMKFKRYENCDVEKIKLKTDNERKGSESDSLSLNLGGKMEQCSDRVGQEKKLRKWNPPNYIRKYIAKQPISNAMSTPGSMVPPPLPSQPRITMNFPLPLPTLPRVQPDIWSNSLTPIQMPTVGEDNLPLVPGLTGLPVHITLTGQHFPYDMDGRRIPVGPNGHYLPLDPTGRLFPHIISPSNTAVPIHMTEDGVLRLPNSEPVPYGPSHNLPVNIDGSVILIGPDSKPLYPRLNLPIHPLQLPREPIQNDSSSSANQTAEGLNKISQENEFVRNTELNRNSEKDEGKIEVDSSTSLRMVPESKSGSESDSDMVLDSSDSGSLKQFTEVGSKIAIDSPKLLSSDSESCLQIVCDSSNNERGEEQFSRSEPSDSVEERIREALQSMRNPNSKLPTLGFIVSLSVQNPPRTVLPYESPLLRNRIKLPFCTPCEEEDSFETSEDSENDGSITFRFVSQKNTPKKGSRSKCKCKGISQKKRSKLSFMDFAVQCDFTSQTISDLSTEITELKNEITRLKMFNARLLEFSEETNAPYKKNSKA